MKARETLKIRNSKGELYIICPIVEKIEELLNHPDNNILIDNRYAISLYLESIRSISTVWQQELGIYDYEIPLNGELCAIKLANLYNYAAVLKKIRTCIKYNTLTEKELDEILQMYL